MKRDYDEVLSEYGVAAYDENASNNKTVIAEREKFEKWPNTLDKQARAIEELQAATTNEYASGYVDGLRTAYRKLKGGE
jgi:hypothetical protein